MLYIDDYYFYYAHRYFNKTLVNKTNNKDEIIECILNIIKTRYIVEFSSKKYFNYINFYMFGKNPIA